MPPFPPGPKPHFLIGNLPLARPSPLSVYSQWAAEFGDFFYYRAGWMKVYFLNHPDLIEYVLVRNPLKFRKDRVLRNSRWFLGDGLLTSEGEQWKRMRRLSQPAFHREQIASYAAIITDYTSQMLSTWKNEALVDIHQEMMRLTLRIVVRTLFGVEAVQTENISRCLNILMRSRTGIRLIIPPVFRFMPFKGMREVRRAVKEMNRTVYDIIARHRRNERDSDDLLSMLIAARDED
jgi:cytochrome P450